MKNTMTTTMKTLAVAGMTMGLALGAQADEPDYLTFTAEEDGSTVTFKWSNAQWVSNSTDGVTWNKYEAGTKITLTKVGDKVMFKGSGVTVNYSNRFTMTGKIAASGDVGTLTDGKGGADVKLTQNCYKYMFYDCTSLTTAPVLPATTLANSCYAEMFNGCTSLTAAPELKAPQLARFCYECMLQRCTSLTDAPVLPATTLASGCYSSMFIGCTSLIVNKDAPGKAWSIPAAATEVDQWNPGMFAENRGTIPAEPSKGVTYYVVPTVAFKPIEVENASWEIIEDNCAWPLKDKVHTNATIKVRYTAKDGLVFAGGSYVTTVDVGKATADPFTPKGYAPAAPQEWRVYVSTNAALDVAGTTWALTDAGGSPITEMDEEGRFKVTTNSQLKVVYTVTKGEGYYFKDGKTTYEAAFTADKEYCSAAEMIAGRQPKASDIGQPKVQLGVVAQRYPWNGMLDVNYKTPYANASHTVTFSANGTVLGTAKGTAGQEATASFDLNTIEGGAFKDKKLKNVKVSATIE